MIGTPLTDIPTPPEAFTDVTVPSYSSFDVIVKVGYVPEIRVVPAPVKLTIWSGAVLVINKVPDEVIGPPLTLIPLTPEAFTEVTVPTPALIQRVS